MRKMIFRVALAALTIFAFTHAVTADYIPPWP